MLQMRQGGILFVVIDGFVRHGARGACAHSFLFFLDEFVSATWSLNSFRLNCMFERLFVCVH